MADLELAFEASPIPGGEQTAFIEGVLATGETTIELDLAGGVRLSGIAFEAGFTGATITVAAVVPWASGEAAQTIAPMEVTIVAGEVVPIAYHTSFYVPKMLLTVNAGQAAGKKIGFFGWRG